MAQQRFCPIHNIALDPSWEVCPYCLKEGRVASPAGPEPAVPPPPPPIEEMPGGSDTVVRPGGPPGAPGTPAGPGSPDVTRRPGGFVPDATRRAPGAGAGETIMESPPEARAWLVVREGEGVGQWHPVSKEVSIGRERENDVVLIEGKVSRFHAKVRLEPAEEGHDQFVVWDLASRNGTFVNGERVRAPVPVRENDSIRVGSTVFVLKVVE